MTRRKDYRPSRPPGRPVVLTAETVAAAIHRSTHSGNHLTEIAAELGVHRNTLYKAVKAHKETARAE